MNILEPDMFRFDVGAADYVLWIFSTRCSSSDCERSGIQMSTASQTACQEKWAKLQSVKSKNKHSNSLLVCYKTLENLFHKRAQRISSGKS